MPKPKPLSRKQVERIVKKEAPGYRVIEQQPAPDAAQRRVAPEESVPSIDAMRSKYDKRGPGTDRRRRSAPKATAPGSRVVQLEPESPTADARRQTPKSIVVSGKGKVTSRQG